MVTMIYWKKPYGEYTMAGATEIFVEKGKAPMLPEGAEQITKEDFIKIQDEIEQNTE